ncbi:dihydrofolate reductase family protein [Candidatus Neomarinimicrobiota bacterium]
MKVSVYVAVSLDGFIAGENGELDWLPGSSGDIGGKEDYGYTVFFESVDTLVMGRKTYDFVLSFDKWPYGRKRVIVLSSTLRDLPDGLPDTVELQSGTPVELYRRLECSGARHIYVDGGQTIQGFLGAGLIDEITITRIPILLGNGISLFGPLKKHTRLRHLETREYNDGLVQSRYATRPVGSR